MAHTLNMWTSPEKLHKSLLADAAAGKTSQPATPGSVELPEKWQNRAKPVSIAQKEAPDITDADKPVGQKKEKSTDADKAVEPKNAADLVNMSPEDAAAWFKSVKGTGAWRGLNLAERQLAPN